MITFSPGLDNLTHHAVPILINADNLSTKIPINTKKETKTEAGLFLFKDKFVC